MAPAFELDALCRFIGTDLHGRDLHGADLTGAVFRKANLQGSNLQQANLTSAVLAADLKGANLTGAVLDGANLEGSAGIGDDDLAAVLKVNRAALPAKLSFRKIRMESRDSVKFSELREWLNGHVVSRLPEPPAGR